jgi:hypothetical protein
MRFKTEKSNLEPATSSNQLPVNARQFSMASDIPLWNSGVSKPENPFGFLPESALLRT